MSISNLTSSTANLNSEKQTLTDLIKNLNNEQKLLLEKRILNLYAKYRTASDEDWDFTGTPLKPNIAQVIKIVNDYHNNQKKMDKLMTEYDLSAFELIANICDYCKQSGTIVRNIDLFNAIEFMQLDEKFLMKFVHILLEGKEKDPIDYIMEMTCLPSHMLLMLTIILVELKNPKMAALFNQRWPEIKYEEINMVEFNAEFEQVMSEAMESLGSNGQSDNHLDEWNQLLDDTCKTIQESMTSLNDNATKQQKMMNELKSLIDNFPKPKLQSILPDDWAELEALANSEIPDGLHTLRMSKKGYDFIKCDLSQENLTSQLELNIGELVFAKGIGTFNPSGFVGGHLVEMNNGKYTVQFIPGTAEEPIKEFDADDIAVGHAPTVRCPEGTRIVAYFKPRLPSDPNVAGWYAGTVGVAPMIQNRHEYLIFFDGPFDGYVEQCDIRLLLKQGFEGTKFYPRASHVLVRSLKKDFLSNYFRLYPEWPLIRVQKNKRIAATKNITETSALVLEVDRQMVLVRFPPSKAWSKDRDCAVVDCKVHDHVDEWLYRGLPRRFPALLDAQKGPSDRSYAARRQLRNFRTNFDMAWPEYDLPAMKANYEQMKGRLMSNENRPQTARKSMKQSYLEIPSRVAKEVDPDVLEKQKKAKKVRFETLPIPDWSQLPKIHTRRLNKLCGPDCLSHVENSDLLLKPVYEVYSPYFKPLLYGWTRAMTHFKARVNWGRKVFYRTPCGLNLRDSSEVGKYLELTKCENLAIDNFVFDEQIRVHILAKHGIEDTLICKDYSNGLEQMPICVVNAVNNEGLPDMTYRVGRYAGEPLIEETMNNKFCSGCSCTDDCSNSETCECQRMTREMFRRLAKSIRNDDIKHPNYEFRTLQDKLKTGIYECNSTCKCVKSRCYNRVLQWNIRIPLQLFMTPEIGWGVRTLVDIPKGAFICTYAGCILTEEGADKLGREIGDKYLCDLDVAQAIDDEKKNQGIFNLDDDLGFYSEDVSEEEEDVTQEVYARNTERRRKNYSSREGTPSEEMEVDESPGPSNSNAVKQPRKSDRIQNRRAAGQGAQGIVIEDYFMNNNSPELFVLDACVSGNIGRFLNHSCEPNVFIQSAFVDTHDIRLPWLGFYTYQNIRAGEELCWDYGYQPGSLPGRRIDCKCGAEECRGRLL